MFSGKHILAGGLWPLAHFANTLARDWQRLWAYARMRASLGDVDPSVVLLGLPELHGTRAIALGRHLYLYRDLYLETQGAGTITIGDGVVISRGVHIVAFAGVVIEEGCMIGEYASLRDANHCFGEKIPLRTAGHVAAPIRLGRNVWIGRGAIVLPGVEIGEGAVVGANSVVTKSVPAGAVVVGAPARMVARGEA